MAGINFLKIHFNAPGLKISLEKTYFTCPQSHIQYIHIFFTSIYSIVKKENRKKSLARSIKFNLVTVSFDRLLSEGLSKPINLQESKGMKKNTYSSPQTKSSGPRPGRSIQAVILVQSNEK